MPAHGTFTHSYKKQVRQHFWSIKANKSDCEVSLLALDGLKPCNERFSSTNREAKTRPLHIQRPLNRIFSFWQTRAASHQWMRLWTQWCLMRSELNDWEVLDGSPPYSLPSSKWHGAECFCLSGGLYRLSNLINKASEICLLFIFPALTGFARAGKLPFSGTVFPRASAAFPLPDGIRWALPEDCCYPLAVSRKKWEGDSRLCKLFCQ